MIKASIGRTLLHTRYLIEKDQLSANVIRLTSGFSPPSVFKDAREQLAKINAVLDEFERIKGYNERQYIPLPKNILSQK